jgi:hypothetical protein
MSGYSSEAVDIADASRPPGRIPHALRRGLASPLPVVLGAIGGLVSAAVAFSGEPLAYVMLGFAGVLLGYATYFIASSYERLLAVKALAQTALEEEPSTPSALTDLVEAMRRHVEELKEEKRRGDKPDRRRGEQESERAD